MAGCDRGTRAAAADEEEEASACRAIARAANGTLASRARTADFARALRRFPELECDAGWARGDAIVHSADLLHGVVPLRRGVRFVRGFCDGCSRSRAAAAAPPAGREAGRSRACCAPSPAAL